MPDRLVGLLKSIRVAHGMSQRKIEKCMKLPEGSIRHLERGRRDLLDYRKGLVDWIKLFLNCVEASEAERKDIVDTLYQDIVQQFSHLLEDKQPDDRST